MDGRGALGLLIREIGTASIIVCRRSRECTYLRACLCSRPLFLVRRSWVEDRYVGCGGFHLPASVESLAFSRLSAKSGSSPASSR